MIEIVVTPTINNCYSLAVTYNKKTASKLRGNEKKIAENFSEKIEIVFKFIHGDECTFFDKIFSNINHLSAEEVNHLTTILLEEAADCNEDAIVYFNKNDVTNNNDVTNTIDITNTCRKYGFYPFLI